MKQITIDRGQRILIVAPQPDDETIGAGGLLSKYGPQYDVLVLTDGCNGIAPGTDSDQKTIVAVRKKEFVAVAGFFKINQFYFIDIPDQELKTNSSKVSCFDLSKYNVVFLPYRRETH